MVNSMFLFLTLISLNLFLPTFDNLLIGSLVNGYSFSLYPGQWPLPLQFLGLLLCNIIQNGILDGSRILYATSHRFSCLLVVILTSHFSIALQILDPSPKSNVQ